MTYWDRRPDIRNAIRQPDVSPQTSHIHAVFLNSAAR
jgi:hypothetical protein